MTDKPPPIMVEVDEIYFGFIEALIAVSHALSADQETRMRLIGALYDVQQKQVTEDGATGRPHRKITVGKLLDSFLEAPPEAPPRFTVIVGGKREDDPHSVG